MPNQLYHANLSIASPSEIERTARQLRVIREEFLTTGAHAMYTPRSIILESWQRCNDFQCRNVGLFDGAAYIGDPS